VKVSPHHPGRIRLGLCCQFRQAPIKFRTTTATALARLPRRDQLVRLAELCRHNADSFLAALQFCAAHGIGAFRIQSQILPLKTHPRAGYRIEQLPEADDIVVRFQRCGVFAKEKSIRTGFHPDQFVVLNSPDRGVVGRAVADLEYQAEVAEWTNADTINIHGGGAYRDKRAALKALRRNLNRLSPRSRGRLTLENDDRTFTPADLLPVCRAKGIPLVYDTHHHRCCPDGLSVEAASAAAAKTWGHREPFFHISSPLEGWHGPRPSRHHDYIDPQDFPAGWLKLRLTVEAEAKAKELAVRKLLAALSARARFVP
jgi:UV DNA damage endonuclease